MLVLGHDKDNSYVYSKLPSGWYFRPINQGTYAFNFSTPGYFSKTITGITATNWNTTRLNVKLVPLSIGVVGEKEQRKTLIYPNPSDGNTRLILPEKQPQLFIVEIFNSLGKLVLTRKIHESNQNQSVHMDLTSLSNGFYLLRMTGAKQTYENMVIIRK